MYASVKWVPFLFRNDDMILYTDDLNITNPVLEVTTLQGAYAKKNYTNYFNNCSLSKIILTILSSH